MTTYTRDLLVAAGDYYPTVFNTPVSGWNSGIIGVLGINLLNFSIAPTSGHTLGSAISMTATGVGTSWTGSNPFSITGGSGTGVISGYANVSGTSATFNLTLSVQGTITIHDSSSNTNQTYTGAAVVPTKPLSAVATAGDAVATVTFIAPADAGGAIITGYAVTSSPGGGTDTDTGTTLLTHHITGLTNGQAYTFTVIATNSAGASPASDASNSVTPEPISWAISPTGGHALGVINCTATGIGTAWTSSSPFIITGGSSFCSLSNYHRVSGTSATFNLNVNNNGGTVTIHDTSINYDQTYTAVAVAPGAPTIGTLTNNNNGTMTVTFTPPTDNGGAAITTYTATGSVGGASNTGSVSPITINIVTFSTSQTVHVTATNTAGTSSASAESNAINPGPVFTLSPSSASTTGIKHLTATGYGTTWTGSNPFSITSGPATTLVNYVNISGTSATFDITVTALSGGPVVIHDSNSSSNANFPVSSVIPPVLSWYQLDTGTYAPDYYNQLNTAVTQLCTANSVTPPSSPWWNSMDYGLNSLWALQVDIAVRALCSILSVTPPIPLISSSSTGQYESSYSQSLDICVRALCSA